MTSSFARARSDAGPARDVELRVLAIVAEQLGVDAEAVTPDVSLTDDLAADSLDLAEIAVAIADRLGVDLPARALDRVRTCGELVAATVQGTRRCRVTAGGVLVRARIVPATGRGCAVLERSWPLSPYALETIAEDARRAGPDAHLELVVVSAAGREALAALEENLAWLFRRGVCVTVRRERRVS